MEKVYHVNTKHKKAGMAILISDKVDFNIGPITKDKKVKNDISLL